MKLYKNINFKHVDKIIEKSFHSESVFLHHTGFMFGVGAIIDSKRAIQRITELKGRDSSKGFQVLVPNINYIIEAIDEPSDRIIRLLEQYSPGNVTFVLKCSDSRYQHLALDGFVAFRVPQNPVLCYFMEKIKSPIVSTSVNKSGFNPELELKSLITTYGSWFDFGFTPHKIYRFADDQASTIVKIKEGIECLREASIPFYEIKQSFEKSMILFVCTGNVCRSPIAEYLLRKRLKEEDLPYRTASGGVLQDGMIISANSSALLLQAGLDASSHVSRKLNESIIRDSWLILTMEERHKEYFSKRFPQYRHKVFTLLEFCGGQGDIADPYQENIEKYKIAYDIINKNIDCLIDILKKEVE